MNNDLNCKIVRDLLPSYADGLTSEETNSAVELHLESCEDCSKALEMMREPEPEPEDSKEEVDYLKKLRRRTRTISLLVGIILMLIGCSLLSLRVFYVGSEAEGSDVYCSVSVSGETLNVNGTLTGSGSAVSRVVFSSSNGMVDMKVYTAPKAFFNSSDFSASYSAGCDIEQVRTGGLIIWQEGCSIDMTTSQLFAATNPFVGDMPSNDRIASILGVADQLGSFTSELQTSEEPYGWTILLDTPISPDEESAAKNIMAADSYAMLACIDNLGYVSWRYGVSGEEREFTVSEDDATAYAGKDIKYCGSDIVELQKLMQSLSIKFSGVHETLYESDAFILCINNNSDTEIYGFFIEYRLGEDKHGEGGCRNADCSALRKGDTFYFEYLPENFPEGTTAIALSDFNFDFYIINDKWEYELVREGVSVPAKYGWTNYYTLSGNFRTGYELTEK